MTKCLNCGTTQGPFKDPDGYGKMCSGGKDQKAQEQRIRECNKRREAWYAA